MIAAPFFAPWVSLPAVLAKTDYFADVRPWPLLRKMNPERWLGNFREDQKEVAFHLPNSFLHFSDELLDQLFVSAFKLSASREASQTREVQV